jgi:chromosome segregation ATPase
MGDETSTTTAGAEKAAGLKEKLQEHMEAAQTRLGELREELASIREEDRETLRQRSAELQERLEQHKAKAKQARADIQTWQQEKTAHTKEAIASWRQKREIKKLQNRADRASAYAEQAVVIASLDFEEAEQAILDALAARFDAEMATAAAP